METKSLTVVLIALLLLGTVWLYTRYDAAPELIRPQPTVAAAPARAEPMPMRAAPTVVSSSEPLVERAPDTVIPDEAALMRELSLLGQSSPTQSLALARRIDEYFPDSPGASERAYVSVRSLVNLKRFHEAQAEARRMTGLYPTDPRTLEVKRHLLVYPVDQPSREEMQGQAL